MANRAPDRRPHSGQARHRPHAAGGRPQPTLDRPPAPHDPPHRQTLGRRRRSRRPLPGAVAEPPHRPRRVQALPGRPLEPGLQQRLGIVGGDRAVRLQGQLPASSRLPREKRLSPGPVSARPPTPRTVSGWILRHPDTLTESEQLRLKAVLVHCPELDALTGHVRSFARMLTEREGERLQQWLDAVRQDDLPPIHTLAAGIDRDRDAVTAGLTLSWNSGVVEGHVNRIKMLKRQMFGRAGFDLLRKRVLLYS
ncbi:transposase [Streptomyces sp. NBC_00161]|uniref:transposase n=1 Tax=Streptomyces sp. NBC_00161 TaxID=2975671 RepID=UPI003255357F